VNIEYFNRIVDTYGIGVDEFLQLFAEQKHQCEICRCPLVLFSTQTHEQPVVDHDHATGAVRGILCRTCNFQVGWIEKDLLRTAKALAYMQGDRKREIAKGLHPPPESKDWTADEFKAWRLRVRLSRPKVMKVSQISDVIGDIRRRIGRE
jgi:hypothetical protein